MVEIQVFEKVKTFMRVSRGCALGAKSGLCSEQFLETDVLFNLMKLNKRGALDAASTNSQCPFTRK